MSCAFLPATEDGAAALEAAPYPFLLLSTDLTVIDANAAYLRAAGRPREQIVGRYLFDAFPTSPGEQDNGNQRTIQASIERAIHTGRPDTIMMVRYSVARHTPDGPVFDERYWSIVHTPVLAPQGKVKFIIQNPIEVTELYTLKKALGTADDDYDFSFLTEGSLLSHGQLLEESNRKLIEERARLRRVFEQAPGFVAILHGAEFIYEIVNNAYYQLVGHRELIGKPVREALPELKEQGYFELLDQVMASGQPFVGREKPVQFQRTPGAPMSERYVDIVFQPLFAPDGAISGVFVQGHDVTEQKRAKDALASSNERWKLAIEGARDGVWDWNIPTSEVTYSSRWKEILGYAEDEIGNTFVEWEKRLHPEDREAALSELYACIDGLPYESEHRLRCKDGSWKWVLARAVVAGRDKAGRPSRMTGTLSDISQKKESDELIWRHASFDTLTGLPNRRLFRDRLEQEVRKAHRTCSELALLFIDLDGFKEVNDLFGHDAGDLLLKQASDRLLACVRESETVARLGGDEFTVILTDLNDQAHLESITQKIIAALARPFRIKEDVAHISASVGITLYPDDASEPEDLIRNADQAMYSAKAAGRNQFRYFTRSMQQEALMRLRLRRDLRKARAGGQLQVHYQPVVELSSRHIFKAEALLRWHHPKLGLVPPSLFIPIAEESGLIHDIGDWVFREAASWSQRWRKKAGQPFQISVNRSPVQFLSKSNSTSWPLFLEEHGLPGNSISVEITEGVLLNASPAVADTLLQYRDAGIQVALDDFGTGYSSMAYLKKFDIDYLKIDQSFVRDMEVNAGSRTIAESIIVMAHKLGLKVIAEGIETDGQVRILQAAGCDYGQGHWFSKPLLPHDFEDMLAARTTG
ncbi:sensor domain-containing protein [Noviherbaspirillum malthae]|uniref:sensor domain-containing protein n=1 Tax=Noviherbaspirillum malthae TaxID=1260987 RepID=UPI00188FBC3F|nr:EAL domain-containing protein [Noviherbaspirillum malthae]